MNDLNERNMENSDEKKLLNNICDIQTNILTEVTKNNEEKNENDDDNNEEEDEDDE